MHDLGPNPHLRMPSSALRRDEGQRAAFGNFCLNAASFPLPSSIEHRSTDEYTIHFIRRKFSGVSSPIINALIEPRATRPAGDIWSAAGAALGALGEPEPDIVKLFLAGSVPAGEAGIGRVRGQSADYHGAFLPFDTPEALELPADYETLLRGLGRHTRRDMRRVRRDAAAAAFDFEFRESVRSGRSERHLLGLETHPRRYKPTQIDAYDTFLAAQERSFHALLRTRQGQLLSCCAGFIAQGAAFVLYQLNHRGYRSASLSLTNRSYTIEHLIGLGLKEFVLPGGGSGILTHACQMRQDGEFILIKRAALPILKSVAVMLMRPDSSVALAVRYLARNWALSR
jgi:hypothetical protein